MTALLLVAAMAASAQEDAAAFVPLDPLTARIYAEAGRSVDSDPDRAVLLYREVLHREPTWEPARIDLGHALVLAGRPEEALALYETGTGAGSLEAFGLLLLELDRRAEAAAAFRRLRDLSPTEPRVLLLEARALVQDAPRDAADRVSDYLDAVGTEAEPDGLLPVATATAESLLAAGDAQRADDLLRAVVVRMAESPEAVASVEDLLVRIEVEEDARALLSGGEVPLTEDQIARLRDARSRFAAGRTEDALRALEVLAVEQPRSVDVWSALASARRATGDVEGAEQALQAGLQLAPLRAELYARLGDLLIDGYGGRRDLDAMRAYHRAVRDGSTDADLWWRTARAERASGAWEQAAASATHALELAPDADFAPDAARWIAGAHRPDPEAVVLPPARPSAGMPAEARRALALAEAWRQRREAGALDRALAEIARAAELAPTSVAPLNLEAAVRVDRQETPAAIAALEESLRRDPAQPDVLVRLAPLYVDAGRTGEADGLWARAAELGAPQALWRLAREQVRTRHPFAARQTLATYFASTAGGPEYADAVALSADVDARIRSRYALGGVLGMLAVGVPAWIVASSRWGQGLDGLLTAAPSAWRDVARILSSIRHEILRHHAASLDDVAKAIASGDADAGRWLAAQWFGPGGAMERFDGYVEELRGLARSAGVPLRLAQRDPVFRPLLAAMARLSRLQGPLESGNRASHVAAELRAVSAVLDGEVMPGLGRIVARLCLLEVDRPLLEGVVDAVMREPAFDDEHGWRPRVEPLSGEPVVVRMFRSDLSDVITNLVRNAIDATRGQTGSRVSIAVGLEDDPITGLERVEIRVRDTSPRRLSTATVRGRFVGRGLGLAVDLTTRAGGSISVEDERGWGKAVVVRLPRAEPEEDA